MAVKLAYFAKTSIPVEIEGLTPGWMRDKSLSQIEQFEIFHGNRKLPLAEMFRVTGDAADQCLEMEGALSGVHWIGAGMASGQIRILGSAGRHVGSQMTGGRITVDGDVRDWAGVEMRGGLIHVKGCAGHQVGGAYRGSTRGMTGGTILVDGDANNEIGVQMRRGTIAIRGNAGHVPGFNMIAGTILVFGNCGLRPGAGMRRGTLGLFGPTRPALLSTFRYASTCRPVVIPLMLRRLMREGFFIDEDLLSRDLELHHGDLVALGKGEIFCRENS